MTCLWCVCACGLSCYKYRPAHEWGCAYLFMGVSPGMDALVTGLIGCKGRGVYIWCLELVVCVCWDTTASAAPDSAAWLSCVIFCMKQQLTSSPGWWPHTNTLTHTHTCAGDYGSRHLALPAEGSFYHTPGTTSPLSQRWNLNTKTVQQCGFFCMGVIESHTVIVGKWKVIPKLF